MASLRFNKTFSAMVIPAYRLLLASMLCNFLGMQMQMVARGILAYQIGGSNSAIAVVSLGWGIPMLLFGLVGGAVADRFAKQRLMIVAQACMAALAIVSALMVHTGAMNLFFLFITGMAQGMIFSFSGPARQAIIPEVTGDRQMMNAIALNSAGMNFSRVVGPSLAGALVAVSWIDIEGVFIVQAALNLAGLLFVLWLPFARTAAQMNLEGTGDELTAAEDESWRHYRREPREGGMGREVMDGLRYVMASPILLTLLIIGLVPSLLGMSYQNFLPVFAKDVFGNGADRNSQGLGLMMTMTGIGALVGSLLVAALQDFPRRTLLQLGAGLGFGLSLMLFAVQADFIIALIALTLVGFSSTFFQSLNSTMVMSASNRRYYGRVMSVNLMTFALMPLGTLPVGFAADLIGRLSLGPLDLTGIQVMIALCGLLIVAFILLTTVKNPRYRNLEQSDLKRFAAVAVDRLEEAEPDASRGNFLPEEDRRQPVVPGLKGQR